MEIFLLAFVALTALLGYCVRQFLKERANLKSARGKRSLVAIVIILLVFAAFGWMFWMLGEAGYNQTIPRLK